jgi:hypothetical protein
MRILNSSPSRDKASCKKKKGQKKSIKILGLDTFISRAFVALGIQVKLDLSRERIARLTNRL